MSNTSSTIVAMGILVILVAVCGQVAEGLVSHVYGPHPHVSPMLHGPTNKPNTDQYKTPQWDASDPDVVDYGHANSPRTRPVGTTSLITP